MRCETRSGVIEGLVLPAFCDAHVHLDLVDPHELLSGGIGRVLDLGSTPASASAWRASVPELPDIDFAGPILTAPGGYPSTSGWAVPASLRELGNAQDAATAIADLVRMGAHVAKVALNSEAGPVWGDDLLSTIVKLARASGLPVIAHAQGTGQAERALHAGVACLAHTPWTERLSDDVVRKMATSMAWISTLDIHGWGAYNQDFDRAINNLERFARWGGTVHYGTDLGNGPLPVGLNRRELAALLGAGLSVRQLLATLRGPLPHQHPTRFVTVIPDVQSVEDISGIEQLARAVIIQSPDREELQP